MAKELKTSILSKEYKKKLLQEEKERPLIEAIAFFEIFKN